MTLSGAAPRPTAARLLAAIRADRQALVRLMTRLARVLPTRPWPEDDPQLYLVAVTLEHYYTACETLMERIAREFEGVPRDGARWHQELLETMALDIPGVRPAVLGPAAVGALRELLAFRHFMRHAYAVALRPGRMAELALLLAGLDGALASDLDRFEALLEAASAPGP